MKRIYILALIPLIAALTACGMETPEVKENSSMEKTEYIKISQAEAKKNLDKNPGIVLVDVRTAEEYNEIRIPGSILLPDYEIEALAASVLPDKDAEIYVYCRTGRRSMEAALKLISLGYTRVYDMGGIVEWEYETVSGP
jgi:phage shock protein E